MATFISTTPVTLPSLGVGLRFTGFIVLAPPLGRQFSRRLILLEIRDGLLSARYLYNYRVLIPITAIADQQRLKLGYVIGDIDVLKDNLHLLELNIRTSDRVVDISGTVEVAELIGDSLPATGEAIALPPLVVPSGGDTTRPSVLTGTFPTITSAANDYIFAIAYSDNVLISHPSVSSVGVSVTGPGGFNKTPTLISTNPTTNAATITATYRVAGPFSSSDNSNVYTIAVAANAIADTSGNRNLAATVGTFAVNIQSTVVVDAIAPIVAPSGAFTPITAGTGSYQTTVLVSDSASLVSVGSITIASFRLLSSTGAVKFPSAVLRSPLVSAANISVLITWPGPFVGGESYQLQVVAGGVADTVGNATQQTNVGSSILVQSSGATGTGTQPNPAEAIAQRTIRASSLGHNGAMVALENYNGIAATLGSAIAQTGCKTIRLPGGDESNYWNQAVGGLIQDSFSVLPNTAELVPELVANGIYAADQRLPIALAYRTSFLTATAANIAAIVAAAGVTDVTWAVNVVTHTPQQEIAVIQSLLNAGVPIRRLEMGNELYFDIPNYAGTDSFPVGFRTSQLYAQQIKNIWMPAFFASFPTLPMLIIARARNNSIGNLSLLDREGSWNNYLLAEQVHLQPGFGGFTEHPYYSTNDIGLSLASVGSRSAAQAGAIAAYAQISSKMESDSFSIFPSNTPFWITETAVLDESARVIVGQSWIGCLLILQNHCVLYKDTRVQAIYNHVLQGNYYWDAVTDDIGSYVNESLRGTVDQPYQSGVYPPLSPTRQGQAQQLWGEVFNPGGTGYLLRDEPGSMAWRVFNQSLNHDQIVAFNATDAPKSFSTPSDRNWITRRYSADPWSGQTSPAGFPTAVFSSAASGSIITLPAFSIVILVGSVASGSTGDTTPPTMQLISSAFTPGTTPLSDTSAPVASITGSTFTPE